MLVSTASGPSLKIGIIRSSSIGDVVLACSSLHLLDKLAVPVELYWIGRDPALSLVKAVFPHVRCIELKKNLGLKTILDQLRELHFLLDLQTNIKTKLLCYRFRTLYKRPSYSCSKRTGWRVKLVLLSRFWGRKRILPARFREVDVHQYRMMSNSLLEALSHHLSSDKMEEAKKCDPFPIFPNSITNTRKKNWQTKIGAKPWIVVAPGASYETKRAPIRLFADIITKIRDLYCEGLKEHQAPLGLMLLGDVKDRKICLELVELLRWEGSILNLAGKLSLQETALALEGQGCLLSNDSSLAHISEAVGTPVAVVFGPTVEAFGFAPRMPESRSFSTSLGCRPCSKHGKTPCRYQDHLCFTSLDWEPVSRYVVNLLLNHRLDPIPGS